MTDLDLVRKKLAFIQSCVEKLRTSDLDRITTDDREQAFVLHNLQIAIQAVLDVASHIVSDDNLGEPTTNAAVFRLLANAGRISDALCETLVKVVGFRNIVVHAYQDLDLEIVKSIISDHLDDLIAFVNEIK